MLQRHVSSSDLAEGGARAGPSGLTQTVRDRPQSCGLPRAHGGASCSTHDSLHPGLPLALGIGSGVYELMSNHSMHVVGIRHRPNNITRLDVCESNFTLYVHSFVGKGSGLGFNNS